MVEYKNKGNIEIIKVIKKMNYAEGVKNLAPKLNTNKGMLLVSNFEYPGRYTRWDIGFVNPPLQITVRKNCIFLDALNQRGEILVKFLGDEISKLDIITQMNSTERQYSCEIKKKTKRFNEEERSKQPSIFSILRIIIDLFRDEEEKYLGLYGAFGYDLAFQFEDIERCVKREDNQRDLVLYLPDEILVVDHRKETSILYTYDFNIHGLTTNGLLRDGVSVDYVGNSVITLYSDHAPNEYANIVKEAKNYFKRGDLFEVVPGQTFYNGCSQTPSEVFDKLVKVNPSPYSFLMNLGEEEYLVGTSPEMYVRVTGNRVETCPISGTVARGKDSIADSEQILQLLNSKKDYAELTMCTDVDRNDKSRICKSGSVKVIGRRHIEMYSRLIHTVDHVDGELKDGFDALDAFLSHAWAVTVTGAPKLWAMEFLEKHEKTPRLWYGGAIGTFGFNGDMNTGLTIRTVRIKNGIAEIRVGATLLYDSVPEEEEVETRLKASALIDAINTNNDSYVNTIETTKYGAGKNVLLIDHEDSFVHTLANYLSQNGATVTTWRYGFTKKELNNLKPDLVVLSPGPGRPSDFNLHATIAMLLEYKVPIFGVCLGLQGIVEYFGGTLGVLDYPMHGKSVNITTAEAKIFKNLNKDFKVGLYHSLYADKNTLPDCLSVTAMSEYGIIMAIEHKSIPIWAVQFHPESILSMTNDSGYKLIENIFKELGHGKYTDCTS